MSFGTPVLGTEYQVDSLTFGGWTEGDGSGHEGYRYADFFDQNNRYLGADQHGIEPLIEFSDDDHDDEITERSLFIDANQGERKDDRAFGFIGTNDTDDYQGWFFSWPGREAKVTTQAEVEAVIESLEADETEEGSQTIPFEWAKAKLAKHLEKFPLTRKITISGNWRKGGPENEWAGTGTVDDAGAIECSADLGDEAYEAIQDQIEDGETSGSVTVHSDEQDRDITYDWQISN